MPFCTYCGTKTADNARFCPNCGTVIQRTENFFKTDQKEVYDGKIHKCPHCGEVLGSFAASCPACGYELRGKSATESIQSFYRDLMQSQTVFRKDQMIRNFPVLNAREDIIEFMILASTNLLVEAEPDLYEAWTAKLEQTYQKARLLFGHDSDFNRIQKIYDDCHRKADRIKHQRKSKWIFGTIVRNIAPCIGVFLMITAVIVESTNGEPTGFELASIIVLIASAAGLYKRRAMLIDYAIGGISGALAILLSLLLYNGSGGQLCGCIVLILVAVNYFKNLNRSGR